MNSEADESLNAIDYFLAHGAKAIKTDTGNWELQFYHTDIEDNDLEKLQYISNLETIVFYLTNITDAGIEKLKKINGLRKLGLYSCRKITNGSINTLSELELSDISLIDTNFSKEDKEELQKLSPNLKIHTK